MITSISSRSPSFRVFCCAALLLGFPVASRAEDKPEIRVLRHVPCNLFDIGEPVRFSAEIKGTPAGEGIAEATLMDETGKEILRREIAFHAAAGKPASIPIELGVPGRGYYELIVRAKAKGAEGQPTELTARSTLGVMDFVRRSADEVRKGGFVFGLKWWGGIQRQREMEDAMVKLGLQWTRIIQNEGGDGSRGRLTLKEILGEYPMNAVIKVERFPKELYDAEKYGPIGEWDQKFGRGSWTLKSLPRKEPYQKWLREELAAIPADQNCFEIWNEPWDKLSPEDFATLSQWIAEVILEQRPDAIIGPNLYGSVSPYEYDARVIDAGGMKGMKMVALHPYASSENREWLRDYRAWLKSRLGREMEIYITEYGSHSTPQGPVRRSEMEQSRRVVRQSLALYAEGVKALLPHWTGQKEADPTYVEDWFGFVRKNEEPKPVLIAHANCARLIDASTYLGDLWFGPGVGAMVFRKDGVHTLALWTQDVEEPGVENTSRKEIVIEPGVPRVTRVDLLGREEVLEVRDGRLSLTLDEAPVYLVGIGADLAGKAVKELRADRWPKPEKAPRVVRKAGRLAKRPSLDGKFTGWEQAARLSILNPKVNGDDCSASGYLAWDEAFLYVGVNVRDNEMFNKQPLSTLYRHDSVELLVSTEPRESGGGFGPNDHQFFLTPTSAEGKPVVAEVTSREAGTLADVKDAVYFAGKTPHGWAVELALPWKALPGFKPAPGAKLAVEIRVNDADTSHERFKLDPGDVGPLNVTDPSSWSFLILEESIGSAAP